MTEAQAQSVLKRMAQQAEAAPVEVPLTVSRAVRLATTRAADQSIALVLSVTQVTEESRELDDLLAQLNDDMVMMGLSETGGTAERGMIACSQGLAAASSEVQTFGQVSAEPPEPRPVSSADVALLRPYLEAVIDELQLTTQHTALDGWAAGVTVGDRYARARSVGFALSDQVYRHVTVSLDLDGNGRDGMLMVALPMASQPALPKAGEAARAIDWAPAFQGAVRAAPVRLDAVLHRFDMPLATAADLHPGQVVPLRGASLGNIRLEDLDHNIITRGRLGQLAGFVAVRVEAPDVPHMQDFGDDLQAEGLGGAAALPGMSHDGLADTEAALDLSPMAAEAESPGLDALAPDDLGDALPDVAMAAPMDLALPTDEEVADDAGDGADGLALPEAEGVDLDLPMADGLAPMAMADGLDLPLDDD